MSKSILFLLAAFALASVVLWRAVRPASSPDGAAARTDLAKYGDVPDFSFPDQHAQRTTPADLRGSVWIANFIFTQCTSICPTMSGKMVQLQRALAAPELRFVSFSVDPEHDTPAVLAEYAERWSPGEQRWRLLSTDVEGLHRTARALGVAVEKSDDAENPIMHSNRFFLVDSRGVVRGIYSSEDEAAMAELVTDAGTLIATEFPASRAARAELDGAGLFAAYGCAACHSDAKLAPPLEGTFGSEVALDGAATQRVDEAYLRESIIDPAAKLVAGYRATMPWYGATLVESEVEKLVEHVRTLKAPDGAPTRETPIEVVDPVCKMTVTAVSTTPSCEFHGKRYWFCCQACCDEFLAAPSDFGVE